jgi:hypothetical protein
MFVFQSLAEVRQQTEQWLKVYKEERPHESMGRPTPRGIFVKPNVGVERGQREELKENRGRSDSQPLAGTLN